MAHIQVFGIRHHGPGSTKRLLKALQGMKPDCLLVEAPYDGEKSFYQVNTKGLQPPVALLMYEPKDFQKASYLPFANFSPEWQALKYALRADIPIKAMDLSMGIQLGLEESTQLEIQDNTIDRELLRLLKDPLGYIAHIAGYEDSERWWEHTFEQEADELQVFEAINEMIGTLRTETSGFEQREILLREAHMRKVLRKAIKEGFDRIAIVCGAWHAPALVDYEKYKSSEDNKLLRGLKKIKLNACWIPWSYDRLAKSAGYSAGVISPAWYDLLYGKRKESNIRWMTKAARLFRKEDMDSSAAHVIEAVRLADTLAAMRQMPVPGIEELEEAAITIFCEGDPAPLELIRERLVIGNAVGKVPIQLSNIPLQKDFEQQVKKARLSSHYHSTESATKDLDFRKETQKRASVLLHRLSILSIPWGNPLQLSGRDLGSFKERWRLKWRPDYAIRIIQASMYGNTVEQAVDGYAQWYAGTKEDLASLLGLLDRLLKADLPDTVAAIIPKIESVAAQAKDVLQLASAVPALVNIIRYGSTQAQDRSAVEALLDSILPRIFIGLPAICRHLEEDPAQTIFQHILAIQSNLGLVNRPIYTHDWQNCLWQICGTPDVHPLLLGACHRVLFDTTYLSVEDTARALSLALSSTEEPSVKAMWLEGFLHGSALLIIHQPALWNIINAWVRQLPEAQLYESLPLLRRTFSKFSRSERELLLQLAKGAPQQSVIAEEDLDEDRLDILLPFMEQLFSE